MRLFLAINLEPDVRRAVADATVPLRAAAPSLRWAAEPKLEDRKRMGFKVIIFLVVQSGLFFAAKKRIWSKLH